jgi:biotin carboxyl carrier protein
MTFEIEVGGGRRTITVEPVGAGGPSGGRFRVARRVASHPGARPPGEGPADEVLDLDVRPTDLGLCLIECVSRRVVHVAVTDRGSGQWLLQFAHGTVTALVDGRLQAGRDAALAATGLQRVTAPMPGRVVRVLVQPGDDVLPRQGLIVIEAMKMENELAAARAGRVREVTVTPGAAVEAGRLLVVIE